MSRPAESVDVTIRDVNDREFIAFPFTQEHKGRVDSSRNCEACGRPGVEHEAFGPVWVAYPGVGVYGVPDGSMICGTWCDSPTHRATARELRDFLRGRDVRLQPRPTLQSDGDGHA